MTKSASQQLLEGGLPLMAEAITWLYRQSPQSDHESVEAWVERLRAQPVENIPTAEEGAATCARLGIDVPKWAAETRAKVATSQPVESAPVCKECGRTFDICDNPNVCSFSKPVESEPSGDPEKKACSQCGRANCPATQRHTDSNAYRDCEQAQHESELTRLTEENARLTRQLTESQHLRRELSERMQTAEQENARLTREYLEAQRQRATAELARDKLRLRLRDARKALRDQARGLKRLSDVAQLQAAKLLAANATIQQTGEASRVALAERHAEFVATTTERDTLSARVNELEASRAVIADLNKQNADALAVANARAERMGAVVAAAVHYHASGDPREREALGEALAALDSMPAPNQQSRE